MNASFLSSLPATAARARGFAAEYHGDRRYGDGPYVDHLDDVAEILAAWDDGGDRAALDELLAAAYLHDVLEDTTAELDELVVAFGTTIALAAWLCTDCDGPTRRDRKRATNRKFSALQCDRRVDALALCVKVADRLANVRKSVATKDSRLEMYRREHDEFRTATQRGSLAYPIWEKLECVLREGVPNS